MTKTEVSSETTAPQCDKREGVGDCRRSIEEEMLEVVRLIADNPDETGRILSRMLYDCLVMNRKLTIENCKLKAELEEMKASYDASLKAQCDRIRRLLQEKRDAEH